MICATLLDGAIRARSLGRRVGGRSRGRAQWRDDRLRRCSNGVARGSCSPTRPLCAARGSAEPVGGSRRSRGDAGRSRAVGRAGPSLDRLRWSGARSSDYPPAAEHADMNSAVRATQSSCKPTSVPRPQHDTCRANVDTCACGDLSTDDHDRRTEDPGSRGADDGRRSPAPRAISRTPGSSGAACGRRVARPRSRTLSGSDGTRTRLGAWAMPSCLNRSTSRRCLPRLQHRGGHSERSRVEGPAPCAARCAL